MYVSNCHRAAITFLSCLLIAPAFGQQANSREQEQLRRLRQQIQQLQQEQSTQQQAAQRASAEKAEVANKLTATQSEVKRAQAAAVAAANKAKALGETQKQLDAMQQERDALLAKLQTAQGELQTGASNIQKLRTNIAELQRGVGARDSNFADLEARHSTQAQGLQTCIANNQGLQAVGQELLERLANRGLGDMAVQNEPFFQFQRVKLENLVQGYQDKLDQKALRPNKAEPGRGP
jgi:chromosome segregation ATPase